MTAEQLLATEDATGLAACVSRGDVSPTALVDAAISRAEKLGPHLNAVVERLFEDARRRAREIDRSLPLAGVPMALKDLGVRIAGVPSHEGSRAPTALPSVDSPLVQRYRAAGLIPIATTSTPEFGLRHATVSAAFGTTNNPWNAGRTVGGSSGGSAALVAARVVAVAHGTDSGGSIRIPSACTGLVGLRPSRGRVDDAQRFSDSWMGLMAEHVLTRSVRDSARILDLSASRLPEDEPGAATFAEAAATPPSRLCIGVVRHGLLGRNPAPEVAAALDVAVEAARKAGHRVEEIALPIEGRPFLRNYARVVCASVAGKVATMSRMLGVRVEGRLERGTRILNRFGQILGGGEIVAAWDELQADGERILAQAASYDTVLMPIIAEPPVSHRRMQASFADAFAEGVIDRLRLTRSLRLEPLFDRLLDASLWFSSWAPVQNVTGQPAIALPVHMTHAGLPVGIQAVGRRGGERTILQFGAQLEDIIGWRRHRPDICRG